MIRVTLLILLFVYSLAGCGPVRQNPIELFPFEYHPSYEVQEVSVQWVVVTATPPPAKTSTVTTSLGVTMGGYDVPVEQLLTEQEQRQIVHALKKVVGQVPKSSCVATVTFEDLDYQFRGHEYWATVTLSVVNDQTEILRKSERLWSAEGMSTSQRWNTYPQVGKQALARQFLDSFGSFLASSADDLSGCA